MTNNGIHQNEEARRRLGCVVVTTRADTGAVLMVLTTYREKPILPGGAAHPNELIGAAAARELLEELGLVLPLTHFIAVDQVDANRHSGAVEGINVVLDGGELSAEAADAVTVPDTDAAREEIADVLWILPADLDRELDPAQAARVRQALAAREAGHRLPLLFRGEDVKIPPPAPTPG
ncbi:NUDIX domain-containing protein [Kitasatospora sp. SUK 42]|uniref:NUDIX domain-containing protein n=1 Tax=Kitasatospora sp. SUK 42 TaxID=1588882 RepID=UPI0018CA18FA|nr:NUDIX domain-containing protein [Kitasatospora sp. SUK 42]MBV2153344.1 NUDIX domain-containing protein [Kitasatospora sp. SUK 42]